MINSVGGELEAEIEARTGQKVRTCYQCKKCSSGCPVAFAMDLLPHEVMKMVQYGQKERLLAGSSIWLCASCDTCTTRCPNEIDIAGVMDGLRHIAIENGIKPSEREVGMMHRSFLGGIRLLGRTNEPVLIGGYKAMTGKVLDDIGLGAVMFLKRKIKLVPRTVKSRRAVRGIFQKILEMEEK